MGWVQGQYLWVRYGREPYGILFVIRRKLGKAVQRNQLKRRLRHICRLIPLGNKGLVVLAQPPAIQARFQDLLEELGRLVSLL